MRWSKNMRKGAHRASSTGPRTTTVTLVLLVAVVAILGVLAGRDVGSSTDDSTTAAPAETTTTTEASTATTVPLVTGSDTTATTAPEPTGPTIEGEGVRVVAPSGDDDGPGTLERPWETIGAALQRLRPGETLYIREGTYHERIRPDQIPAGEPERPITVTAFPDEAPVLKGLLWLTEPDHWVIDGLTIEWDPETGDDDEHMVKFTGGDGWVFTNNEVRGARSFAAVLVSASDGDAPRNWLLSGNCIYDTVETNDRNQDQLIYVNTGDQRSDGVIERNVLWGAPNGAGVKLGGEAPTEGGAHGVTVRYNTIIDTSQSILIGWQASDNRIEGNLMAMIPEGRSHIRAFEVMGSGNEASFNAYDAEPLVWADSGYRTVEEVEGNRFVSSLEFSNPARCDGWRASGGIATQYGHLADGE